MIALITSIIMSVVSIAGYGIGKNLGEIYFEKPWIGTISLFIFVISYLLQDINTYLFPFLCIVFLGFCLGFTFGHHFDRDTVKEELK